jgi:hypothetical protein
MLLSFVIMCARWPSHAHPGGFGNSSMRECACPACPPALSLLPWRHSNISSLFNPRLPHQVGGYTLLEVCAELQTVMVMEGLTEDAVFARLHEGDNLFRLFLPGYPLVEF